MRRGRCSFADRHNPSPPVKRRRTCHSTTLSKSDIMSGRSDIGTATGEGRDMLCGSGSGFGSAASMRADRRRIGVAYTPRSGAAEAPSGGRVDISRAFRTSITVGSDSPAATSTARGRHCASTAECQARGS